MDKEFCCNAGDPDLIPRSGRSPGEGNGNPLQYSCLENSMDTGSWQVTVHGVVTVGHDLATKPPLPQITVSRREKFLGLKSDGQDWNVKSGTSFEPVT